MAESALSTSASAQLDRTFSALAHPARRAMLARLARGPASASELGAPFAMSQPAVSKHLKVLEQAALIQRGRDAQWRPCELRTETLREADKWLEAFRRTWENRLDRLDVYLTQVRGREGEWGCPAKRPAPSNRIGDVTTGSRAVPGRTTDSRRSRGHTTSMKEDRT